MLTLNISKTLQSSASQRLKQPPAHHTNVEDPKIIAFLFQLLAQSLRTYVTLRFLYLFTVFSGV